jgi:hypothetical protein
MSADRPAFTCAAAWNRIRKVSAKPVASPYLLLKYRS